MKKPENNDYFPLEEYEARLTRIRARMKAEGFDALLLTSEPNIVYVSGFLNGYWICKNHDDAQVVLVTADPKREPILLLPCHLEQTARTSCISDIRVWSQFDASGGHGSVATVVAAIRQCGLADGRVGAEIGPHDRLGLSLPFFHAVQAALPGVSWRDASKVMGPVRSIKSPREIDTIRTTCRISCEAIEIGMDAIKAGMSEKELGQIIALEIAKRSPDVCTIHPWFLFVHATGRGPSAYDGMPTGYRFRKGDYVYVDGGFNFRGYNADMIRCASIGAPDAETERYYRDNCDANMAAIAAMKPGVSCKQVYEVFADRARELGYSRQIEQQHAVHWTFLGHSWGLSVHEMPYLDGVTEDILQPGMIFSIEGNLFDRMPMSVTKQILKNEENVLITDTGHEVLTPLRNDLWIAPA